MASFDVAFIANSTRLSVVAWQPPTPTPTRHTPHDDVCCCAKIKHCSSAIDHIHEEVTVPCPANGRGCCCGIVCSPSSSHIVNNNGMVVEFELVVVVVVIVVD